MARTHNRVSSRVWTGRTARELRAHPPYVRVFQHWLMENESAVVEPYGLYHLQLDLAVLQIGGGVIRSDLEAALEVLEDMEFCEYDETAEWIWIREMAAHQVLEAYQPLKERDWRVKAAQKFYDALPEIVQLGHYFDHYADLLRLEHRREFNRAGRGSRPLRPIRPLEGANPNPTPTQPPSSGDLLEEESTDPATNGALVLAPPRAGSAQLDATRAAFEAWWALYPLKTGKGKAWASWLKHKPPVAKLMDTTRAYLDSVEWMPRNDGRAPIPYPATFLNNEQWEDTPTSQSGRAVLGAKNAAMVQRTSGFGED